MIRNQKKQSSIAVVPGIHLELNPLAQANGSAFILRNFIPERGRLTRKGFSPDYSAAPQASTGSATSDILDAGTGAGTGWTDPNNITSSDDARASIVVSGSALSVENSAYLTATNFGFSIGTDRTILGVEITYEGHSTGTGGVVGADAQLVHGGSIIGSSKSVNTLPESTPDGTEVAGSPTDTWSAELTPTLINDSTFGFRFRESVFFGTAGSETINIDNMRIRVYHAPSGTVGPISLEVNKIFDFGYYRSSAPEKKLILFRKNGAVYKRQSSHEQEIFPGITSFSAMTPTRKPFAGSLSNRLFFSDGTSSYVYDGRLMQTWGMARTVAAPAVSAVAGSLTAATGLKAAITWVVQDEAGNRVHESSRTDKSAFTVLSSQNLRVDKSALTPPAKATHWSTYVSFLNGEETLRRAATTAIVTDTVDISALPAATNPEAPTRNDPPPPSSVGMVLKNRLFLRDDTEPNKFWFSALGEVAGLLNGSAQESFPGRGDDSISDLINSDFVPDREIRAMVEHSNNGFLFSETNTYMLVGEMNLLDNRSPRAMVKLQLFNEGCMGPDAAVSTPYGVVWMNPARKIYLWNSGQELFDIGEPIQPILDNVQDSDAKNVSMAWYSGNGRQWLVMTLESGHGVSDGGQPSATRQRCLIYDFSQPAQRFNGIEPGSWFEWTDNEYVYAGVYEEEDGQPVLLLGTSDGSIKQADVIAQPAYVEYTIVPGKTYASDTLQNNPACSFRTGLLRPEGDNWVTGHYISIHTGSQEEIESLTTQPTLELSVDPPDPASTPGITLTLDTALTNQERRAYLAAEDTGNANGALAKAFLFQARYSAGIDTLETNQSRNKGAVNTIHRTALTWSPQADTAQ